MLTVWFTCSVFSVVMHSPQMHSDTFKHTAMSSRLFLNCKPMNHDREPLLIMNSRPYLTLVLCLSLITYFNVFLFIYVLAQGVLPFILSVRPTFLLPLCLPANGWLPSWLAPGNFPLFFYSSLFSLFHLHYSSSFLTASQSS